MSNMTNDNDENKWHETCKCQTKHIRLSLSEEFTKIISEGMKEIILCDRRKPNLSYI